MEGNLSMRCKMGQVYLEDKGNCFLSLAAVANLPVMILDEATSSIDIRTEVLVQQGMDNLMRGRTTYVIAH